MGKNQKKKKEGKSAESKHIDQLDIDNAALRLLKQLQSIMAKHGGIKQVLLDTKSRTALGFFWGRGVSSKV